MDQVEGLTFGNWVVVCLDDTDHQCHVNQVWGPFGSKIEATHYHYRTMSESQYCKHEIRQLIMPDSSWDRRKENTVFHDRRITNARPNDRRNGK